MAIAAEGSSDLFIDGMLAAGGAGRFPTINPATARRCWAPPPTPTPRTWTGPSRRPAGHSTVTDWATDTALRVRCIRQLRDAMREHVEELRDITMAEVGAPAHADRRRAAGGPGGGSEFLR